MKILFAKTFGLGNAVMAMPALKAIVHEHGAENVDVLVGDGPDDLGAAQVFQSWGLCKVYTNIARDRKYDVAVLSIPFDGRWKNGVHFLAEQVLDGRTRPDPATFGFSSWQKHEVEYQMENARILGFSGATRDTSFYKRPVERDDAVFLGIGYKRDKEGFWQQKHWGDENFAELAKLILWGSQERVVCTEGSSGPGVESLSEVGRLIRAWNPLVYMTRTDFSSCDLRTAFRMLSRCHTYIGNDTGMMHVAGSMGLDVIGLFFMENAHVKNGPVTTGRSVVMLPANKSEATARRVFDIYKELRCS